MKKCIFFLMLLCVTSLNVKSQTDSFFKYSNVEDGYRDGSNIYSGSVTINPLTPESVPLSSGIAILLSCVLLYLVRKMRVINKIKLVVIMLSSVLFLQCTPSNDDVAADYIEVKGEMGVGRSRLHLDMDGTLEWQREDKIYMMSEGVDNTIAVFTAREINENNDVITLISKYNAATCPNVMYRNLYSLGNWRYIDDTKITFSIYAQSGYKSDIGEHFIASARDVVFKTVDEKTYTFPMTQLDPMVSVAFFDMSLFDVNDVVVEYANCYNTINLEYNGIAESDYVGDAGYTYDKTDILESYESGPILVKNLTDVTCVVLLPQKKPLPNTVVYFKNNGKVLASVNFPKGISANKMYLSYDGKPITVKPDSLRLDIEAVEYNFCSE